MTASRTKSRTSSAGKSFPRRRQGISRLLRLDRQAGQTRRLALWCEASGMVPQLQRIADPFGIGVYSSGGFDSVTAKHQIARLWTDAPVTVLHIGDHDPSGVHCFSSLSEDVASFADHYGGDVQFVRLAVTPGQAAFYEFAAAPPKPTDRRRFDGDETWQAEALDPRDLADIVRVAIETRLDRVAYERVLEDEAVARLAVLDRLSPGREPRRPLPICAAAKRPLVGQKRWPGPRC